MGVYIKGMEMPKSCDKCWQMRICSKWTAILKQDADGAWMPTYPKPKDCPLIEVTEPHRRLIDADALSERLYTKWSIADVQGQIIVSQIMAEIVTPIVVGTPTVIEAEGE